MGATPGGAPRHFWEPEYTTSSSQSSVKKGVPPRDATVSTINKQSCLKTEQKTDQLNTEHNKTVLTGI